jgi:uncharacterized protein with HEPN domain
MKDDRLYLVDMLETARRVQNRVKGLTRAAFDQNEDLQLALAHLLQTIGEAARLVTPATRQDFPTIPWNEITGMRHKIVHDYLRIRFDIVWSTACEISDLVNALAPGVDPIIAKEQAELEKENP